MSEKPPKRVSFAPEVTKEDGSSAGDERRQSAVAEGFGGRLEALKQKRRREAQRRELQSRLLVAQVAQDTFKQALLHFRPADYEEVVVERALDKLCGYPLCSKPVGDWSALPRKKISWKHKAIYEKKTLERFCSIDCMAKSEGIRQSLPLLREGFGATGGAQPVVVETKREPAPQATFPVPGSVSSAMRVEGFKTTLVEEVRTPPKVPPKRAPAESKQSQEGMDDLVNGRLGFARRVRVFAVMLVLMLR